MTIDKKLDALLDYCGITPSAWCYANIGEYENQYFVGPAWDKNNKSLTGDITDEYEEDYDSEIYTEFVATLDRRYGDGRQHANARLIAQSRENLKALILAAEREWNQEWSALYGHDRTIKDCEDGARKAIQYLITRIEASLPMKWEEIKKWLEDCDETK